MDQLKRQRALLEQEKEAMNSLPPNVSDIVSFNLGGEIFVQAHRDTLLFPVGSRFAALSAVGGRIIVSRIRKAVSSWIMTLSSFESF
jgi:hypothetical protein